MVFKMCKIIYIPSDAICNDNKWRKRKYLLKKTDLLVER